jgi:hypothetical protein
MHNPKSTTTKVSYPVRKHSEQNCRQKTHCWCFAIFSVQHHSTSSTKERSFCWTRHF